MKGLVRDGISICTSAGRADVLNGKSVLKILVPSAAYTSAEL